MNSEFEIQSYVSTMLNRNKIVHHGDLNGVRTSRSQANKAKACGMRKGWPDMCIILPQIKTNMNSTNMRPNPGRVVWIEFKSWNGKQSTAQEEMQDIMDRYGLEYFVVKTKTKEEAWKRVMDLVT